jgi:hypothetical protein
MEIRSMVPCHLGEEYGNGEAEMIMSHKVVVKSLS